MNTVFNKIILNRCHRVFFVATSVLFSVFCGAQLNENDIDHLYQTAWEIQYNYPDSAEALIDNALSLLYKSEDNIQKAKVYTVAGVLLQNNKDFDGATDFLLEALKLKLVTGDSLEIAKSFNNIGNTFFLSKHYLKSLDYFNLGIKYAKPSHDELFSVSIYINLGNVYSRLEKNDSALISYYSAESLIKNDTLHSAISDLYLNLGMLLRTLENYSSSLKYLNKALSIQSALDDAYGIAMTTLSIGAVYELQGDYENATLFYEKADSLAQTLGDLTLKKDIVKNRMTLAIVMNSNIEASELFAEYEVLNEQLNELNINNNIAEIEAQYQVERNKKKLALKEAENEQIIAENKRMLLANLGLIIAVLLGGIIAFLIFRTNKQKLKMKAIQAESFRLEIDQRFQEYELKLFTTERITQNRERKKIAGNLHDKLGGLLATMNVLLEVDDPDYKKTVVKVQDLIKMSVDEVRNFSHELAENRVENFSLKEQLESLKKSFAGNNMVKFDILMENFPAEWDKEKESELFIVLLELTRNTFKHAQASHITLQLQKTNGSANILFEDNGKGFDIAKAKKGMGIKSISNRIDNLNGTWSYDSTLGQGTSVNINIPLS